MRPSLFLWILSAPVFTGILIVVLLMIPALAPSLGSWIVGAAIASGIVAVPFSLLVARVFQ